ncbi:reverse transcriptase domain-containing protein [Tanacetum coccineum]
MGRLWCGGDDYEGALVFDDDYKEAPVFNNDQFEEESMPVYDTDIENVIEEEEGFIGKGGFDKEEENMEDVVVVANDLCSSMIQTTLSIDFSKTIDSNPHELIWSQKDFLLPLLTNSSYANGCVGEFVYVAPEYSSALVASTKGDTYGFGIVLITGQKPLNVMMIKLFKFFILEVTVAPQPQARWSMYQVSEALSSIVQELGGSQHHD